MRTTFSQLLLGAALSHLTVPAGAAPVILKYGINAETAVTSWKEQRDAGVVLQELDYSCSAASIATILQGFYGYPVTERVVIDAIGKTTLASFADMAAALPKFGFKGIGLALSYAQLRALKVPVVVYLRAHDGNEHFSVWQGASEDEVWLKDPSWGNMRLPVERFLREWQTRDDPEHQGKILLVLPKTAAEHTTHPGFLHIPAALPPPLEIFGRRRFESLLIMNGRY